MNSITATLSYDGLDDLTKYDAGTSGQEQYVYDASGQRVLRRSTYAGSTTMMVYAFGLEEHQYSGTGTNQANTYYYSLGGMLIGESNGSSANVLLTDALGSVLETISAVANSAAVQGNQVYGPYGNTRYQQGSMGTTKGFTGQYQDMTGLDYYGSRYYDPVVGRFLSADTGQGNGVGMDPYAYVGGNPETWSDPSGQMPCGSGGCSFGGSTDNGQPTVSLGVGATAPPAPPPTGTQVPPKTLPVDDPPVDPLAPIAPIVCVSAFVPCILAFLVAGALFFLTPPETVYTGDLTVPYGLVTRSKTAEEAGRTDTPTTIVLSLAPQTTPQTQTGGSGGMPPLKPPVASAGGTCSFTSDTPVSTEHGKQAIGTLSVGERVLAYNPSTHKMELEPILHVWINHDNDLVDLTITTTTKGPHGQETQTSEVIHTNQKHPFLTEEHGFLPVGKITLGMHIVRADGRVGEVTGWKVVAGTKVMYNLEVAQDHTYTVGVGQWVVHNCPSGPVGGLPQQAQTRAEQIRDAMVAQEGWWFRVETTVGVAYMQDSGGLIQEFVTINESALAKWASRVKALLGQGEVWIEGLVGGNLHAEQVLVGNAQASGTKIVGIGASATFCPGICEPMLLREVGQQFMGQGP